MATETILMEDPSLLYRPEAKFHKGRDVFRNFDVNSDDLMQERVRETYRLMHTNQTVDFVRKKLAYWSRFDKAEMTMREALEKLNALVDESDPDIDLPNVVHGFQTAERIRRDFPDVKWLQLTGLIHDAGKVMALFGEPQWAVVGDTFPVGCQIGPSVVYRDTTFTDNPDVRDPVYGTKLGMYRQGCGLSSVIMSWGHDEYLYRVLANHDQCRLPIEALSIIRFHSFYPWHLGGDYGHLTDQQDEAMLPWIRLFNQYDLYTKADDHPDIQELWPYYENLIDTYLPGKLKW